MATIHIMHGFIGFGKTTTAKKIAKEHSAVRLEIDGFMAKLFGRNPISDGFWHYSEPIKDLIWDIAKETINNGTDVVIDHGFWTKQQRQDVWKRAKQITPNVVFHVIKCDMEVAKARAISRTLNNKDTLNIDGADFDSQKNQFEPIQADEAKNYEIVYHSN